MEPEMGYQKTIDALREENARLKAILAETYEDKRGNVWVLLKGKAEDE